MTWHSYIQRFFNIDVGIIHEITDLRFLTLVISQKAFEITDFSGFEETFCSEIGFL